MLRLIKGKSCWQIKVWVRIIKPIVTEKWYKILKPGAKSWQRGKIRITLEFRPDNLELKESDINNQFAQDKKVSQLDDLCQKIQPENK